MAKKQKDKEGIDNLVALFASADVASQQAGLEIAKSLPAYNLKKLRDKIVSAVLKQNIDTNLHSYVSEQSDEVRTTTIFQGEIVGVKHEIPLTEQWRDNRWLGEGSVFYSFDLKYQQWHFTATKTKWYRVGTKFQEELNPQFEKDRFKALSQAVETARRIIKEQMLNYLLRILP